MIKKQFLYSLIWLHVVAAIAIPYRILPGQTATTANGATAQMLSSAKVALDNFNYAEALRVGRELLQSGALRTAQLVEVSHIMAAAFFPEDGSLAQLDSATYYLRKAIKLAPDVPLTADVRWRGLDSLFATTRAATFAAVAKPVSDVSLTGADGRAFIEVVSTRPSTMRMESTSTDGKVETVQDSASKVTTARLGLRAHDGAHSIFSTGGYEIRIIVRDIETGQEDSLNFRASAVGAPPVLEPIPKLDESLLKPERAKFGRAKSVVSGVLIGGATIALARFGRGNWAATKTQSPDSRATLVGVLIAAGSVVGGYSDRGRTLPENIAANTLLRADAEKRAAAVRESNARKVSDYRVTLKIELERSKQ